MIGTQVCLAVFEVQRLALRMAIYQIQICDGQRDSIECLTIVLQKLASYLLQSQDTRIHALRFSYHVLELLTQTQIQLLIALDLSSSKNQCAEMILVGYLTTFSDNQICEAECSSAASPNALCSYP